MLLPIDKDRKDFKDGAVNHLQLPPRCFGDFFDAVVAAPAV